MTEDGGETGPDEVPLLAQSDCAQLQAPVGVGERDLESLQFPPPDSPPLKSSWWSRLNKLAGRGKVLYFYFG